MNGGQDERAADAGRVAWDRNESDPCERNTPGCSVLHYPDHMREGCEPW